MLPKKCNIAFPKAKQKGVMTRNRIITPFQNLASASEICLKDLTSPDINIYRDIKKPEYCQNKIRPTKKLCASDSSLIRTALKTIYLINTYEVQTIISYTCVQGWSGGGQDSPHSPLSPQILSSDAYVIQAFLELT